MDSRYNPQAIEHKWQKFWLDTKMYFVEPRADKPKFYTLVMFPYPSGDLHMGHMRNYAIGDLVARYHTMLGYNVLNPMGWDAFGLPAENAAIQQGIHPQDRTLANIARMKEEFFKMGIVYDWSREVASCLPEYYQWTQWMFLLMYKRGLAYKKLAAANWCPKDQTVLANEQVVDGRCERCGTEVIKKDLNQWFFKITNYAQRLLDDLDTLESWPDRVKLMQRNWIGRSEGAELEWPVVGSDKTIRFFTTRPDTVYGATFMVLAPEHPLVAELTTPDRRAAVEAYVAQARKQSDIERLATDKEKTGVFIGATATNRFTGQAIPIYIADYVLVNYGTGAIMAVPGGDERDYDFALKYNIPIIPVVAPDSEDGARPTAGDPVLQPIYKAGPGGPPLYTGAGHMINSGPLNGLPIAEAKKAVIAQATQDGAGKGTVIYRLRDWLISRQRYWGAPIPIVYCEQCGEQPVPVDQLPVLLPYDVDFRPSGESPLARNEAFVHTTCPQCGGPARRETDTMDTFVDSSWYFLRFADPHNTEQAFNSELANYWMPVNQYTGGVEHAILHLMYARFFTKVLADAGLITAQEPFARLFTQGMITKDGFKMSKSKGNVVPVDDMVDQYGADTARLFILFIGPPEIDAEWSDAGVEGSARFLQRVWRVFDERVQLGEDAGANRSPGDYEPSDRALLRKAHQTVRRVTDDIARFHFNTAISAIMELVNAMTAYKENHGVTPVFNEVAHILVLLLAPIAPHITEELWHELGGDGSIHQQAWPRYDAALAAEDVITVVVQVNGKVRDRFEVPADVDEATAKERALTSDKVTPFLNGQTPRQVVYVPGRLVNIVV